MNNELFEIFLVDYLNMDQKSARKKLRYVERAVECSDYTKITEKKFPKPGFSVFVVLEHNGNKFLDIGNYDTNGGWEIEMYGMFYNNIPENRRVIKVVG